jgi:endoplasmic reticulum-Golgi intermediate compartment protein 3
MHQYQLKIVPTRYISHGETLESHQFSTTMLQKDVVGGAGGIPGIFVQYEFSPLMVQYEERQRFLLI